MQKNITAKQTHTMLLRYATMAWLFWVAVGLMGLTFSSCSFHRPKRQTSQERLISRIDQYYSALQMRAYTKTQLFCADQPPRPPAERSSLASKLSLTMTSYKIQSLRTNDKDAHAVMHVTIADHDNHYDIVMVDNWQFIQGNWYVVDSAQPLADEPINTLDQKVWNNCIKW